MGPSYSCFSVVLSRSSTPCHMNMHFLIFLYIFPITAVSQLHLAAPKQNDEAVDSPGSSTILEKNYTMIKHQGMETHSTCI